LSFIDIHHKGINELLQKVEAANRQNLQDGQPQNPILPLFEDIEYTPFEYVEHVFFLRSLSDDAAKAVMQLFLKHKAERIKQIDGLLARHSININIAENDYSELDLFFYKNTNYHPAPNLQNWVVSPLWLSICIDLSLKIGDGLINEYPFLRWMFQVNRPRGNGYKELALYGVGYERQRQKRLLAISPFPTLFFYARNYIEPETQASASVLPLGFLIDSNFLVHLKKRAETISFGLSVPNG